MTLTLDLPGPFIHDGGFCWRCLVDSLRPFADTADDPARSAVIVMEGERKLDTPHAPHRDIRAFGSGRFSYWENGQLYFAASDNSDPNRNGRPYRVQLALAEDEVLAGLGVPPRVSPATPLAVSAAVKDFLNGGLLSENQMRETADAVFAALRDPRDERNRTYHLKEYILHKLVNELCLTQGASVRTLTIADQYIRLAQRHLPSLQGAHVVEIGPGRSLGAGLAFRFLGADRYTGIEMHVGEDFNSWSTLNAIETLVRFKYGEFLDNFQNRRLGMVPPGDLADGVTLDPAHMTVLQPESLSRLPLPDASADLVYSNFTFEHIQDPAAMAAEIARVLKPGGLTAHFIDIEDHSDFSQPFNYLVHSKEAWDARYGPGRTPLHYYENRQRASDFKRDFSAHGLEVVEFRPLRSATIPPELHERIDSHFKAYDRDDLQIVWLMIAAVKAP
ncbi:class I SAM-dependent methyltransferase [Azospirillum sp. ST 5-10]|uniref:class I SAM-dependent methyltransferase n=1 Tax=unclassified Azospirillum TaxID=2630922 RepID=UPI003F4A4F93